jgi:two-component system, OmpR family, response regulator PhoP
MLVRAIIVEDETLTRHTIGRLLRDHGFKVWEAADAAACEAILRVEVINIALVDLGLPGRTGQELISSLAQRGSIAILAVTAQSQPDQRIAVLEAGADDYITKPFHHGELIARMRAVLRRHRAQVGDVLSIQGWEVDLDARQAVALEDRTDGSAAPIALTRGEVAILSLLAEAGGRIVSRELLAKAAARPDQTGDLRTVDTLIYRLRRKFQSKDGEAKSIIFAVPGLGYRLATAHHSGPL